MTSSAHLAPKETAPKQDTNKTRNALRLEGRFAKLLPELVDQNSASWNRLAEWLQRLNWLKMAA